MLVSDNDAYTHLYEFLGQEYACKNLWAKGYPSARIIHRLKTCDSIGNRYTNPIIFIGDDGDTIYRQPMQYNAIQYKNFLGNVKIGERIIENKKLVNKPWDFTYNNYLCLQDAHDILISIIFPQGVEEKKRFQLSSSDYHFLWKYMSMYPPESHHPDYDTLTYWSSYKKYFW